MAVISLMVLFKGVTDTKDVLQRFLSQIETRKRLTFLKDKTEQEKKQLEVRKDMMLAELEAFKFAQVKDKEQYVKYNINFNRYMTF